MRLKRNCKGENEQEMLAASKSRSVQEFGQLIAAQAAATLSLRKTRSGGMQTQAQVPLP